MDKPNDGVEVKTYVEKIDKLIANDLNPRTINRKAYESLKKSLKDFPEMKQLREIVVDENLTILGGHQRIHALKELGYSDVTVKQVFGLTEKQKREFIIKDNTASGEWDTDIIANQWDVEELENWGVPKFELGLIEPGPEAKEDDFDTTPPSEPQTVLGDLYEIGEHRLLCGDSTCSDTVGKLMNGSKADITFTSPPYNVGKTPNGNEQKYLNDNDNKNLSDYVSLLDDFTKTALLFSDFVFSNIQSLSGNKIALIEHLYNLRNVYADVMIWDKKTAEPAMARKVLNSRFEYVYIFSNEAKRSIGKRDFRGTIDNIFELNSRQGKEFASIHKATFPIQLPELFIKNFTETSVLDTFCGTGSTMVASHQLNRKCYGMELDPKYCDVIVTRMLKLDPSLTIKRNGEVIEWQTVAIGED
jgi:DNA modification methylase